jgi:ribosomal protein S1
VKPGDPVEVTVLGVDVERRRLSLSLASDGADAGDGFTPEKAPQKLGTFGDLLKAATKPKRR